MLLTTALITTSAQAQTFVDQEPTPRIVVSGTGMVDVAPDMAVLTLSVLRQAETARGALDALFAHRGQNTLHGLIVCI
ncbi:MAG: SIMPL domain-containing protein, partial [Pseudomonadota bacterium]